MLSRIKPGASAENSAENSEEEKEPVKDDLGPEGTVLL
jgi:hypothetical protein